MRTHGRAQEVDPDAIGPRAFGLEGPRDERLPARGDHAFPDALEHVALADARFPRHEHHARRTPADRRLNDAIDLRSFSVAADEDCLWRWHAGGLARRVRGGDGRQGRRTRAGYELQSAARFFQFVGRRRPNFDFENAACPLIVDQGFLAASKAREKPDDGGVARFRQRIGQGERMRIGKRIVRVILEALHQGGEDREPEAARRLALGHAPFLIAIAARQIEAVKEFAAKQLSRRPQRIDRRRGNIAAEQ